MDYNEYAEWDLEGIVDEGRFALYVPDKIAECEFFLNLMSKTTDWNHFRWLTSAFLEAARASLDWICYRAYHVDQGDEYQTRAPDEAYIKGLAKYLKTSQHLKSRIVKVKPKHPLLKELCKHRTETAHYGPLWIKPEKVSSPSEFFFGEVIVRKNYMAPRKKGGRPVLQFARDVLNLIESIPPDVHESSWET